MKHNNQQPHWPEPGKTMSASESRRVTFEKVVELINPVRFLSFRLRIDPNQRRIRVCFLVRHGTEPYTRICPNYGLGKFPFWLIVFQRGEEYHERSHEEEGKAREEDQVE